MLKFEKKGYEYMGVKLGDKVRLKKENIYGEVIGFDEREDRSLILVIEVSIKDYSCESSTQSYIRFMNPTSLLRHSENFTWRSLDDIEIIKNKEEEDMDKTKQFEELIKGMTTEEFTKLDLSDEGRLELMNKFRKNDEYDGEWQPEENEGYFFVDELFCVATSNWRDIVFYHNHRKENYNIFKTAEQAQIVADKIKNESDIEKKFKFIRNYVAINDKDWKIDWGDGNQKKYYLKHDHHFNIWEVDWNYVYQNEAVYMSKKCADKLVEILNKVD